MRLKFKYKALSIQLAFACLVIAPAANAAEFKLDDTLSPRTHVSIQSVVGADGRPLMDNPDPQLAIIRYGPVHYRLNTAAYVGKQATVYYTFPMENLGPNSPSSIEAQWKVQAPFTSGSVRPGQRFAVWSGIVTSAMLEPIFDLALHIHLSQWRGHGRFAPKFAPHFVIDVRS
jgi:hypothetical protein